MSNLFSVGENVPDDGTYRNISTGEEFWLRKDAMFPPTREPGQKYCAVLVTARN